MNLPVLNAIARVAQEPPPRTTWQIKVGTLCNLRCQYCYEWDRLGDRGRLTLDQWRHVFEAVRVHRLHRMREVGDDVITTIVWHGGEPTLHPPGYVRAVLELQQEVLGALMSGPGRVRNAVQTNLTRLGATLSLMVDAGFAISVSADFALGARIDAQGRESDARVRTNLEHLLADGATCGLSLVLGRHNSEHLDDVHDALARMGAAWLNVIPMLPPPAAAPGRHLLLEPGEVVNSLERLFVHWAQGGARLAVHPLCRVLRTALRRRSAMPADQDRDLRRNVRMIVQPDGTLTEQKPSFGHPAIESELCARVEACLDDAGVVALNEAVW